MTDRSVRRNMRRVPYVFALGLVPAFALAWGCGDDATTATGARVNVDPGGTWGAEVAVTVVGRGRVTTSVPGVDCPSGSCFAKYVFPSNTTDGATGGIQLTATATEGAKFLGWSFEGGNVGARGRGPDVCNPVTRATTTPAGITTEPTISLPFGEVDGTVPAGKEASCIGVAKVPLAYKVTATFDAELGPIDAGFDGGADDIVYRAPTAPGETATQAEGLGLTQNGSLYWLYSSNSGAAIAYGASPSSSVTGQTATQITSAAVIQNFRVSRFGVVFSNGQSVFAIRTSSPTSPTSVGTMATTGTCRGLAMDSSSNVYCRTQTTIIRWPFNGSSYGTFVTLYGSGLPNAGNDIVVDSSSGPAYIDTGTAGTSTGIGSLQLFDVDGGVAAAPVSIVSGRSGIQNIRSGTSGFAWTELGSGIYTTTSKSAGASVQESTASTGSVFTLGQDQGSSTGWIAAGTSGIFLAPLSGTASAFRTGSQFSGAAASSQYIFWTTTLDGHVHRARRF